MLESKKKSNFYSGLLSILLVCLILTIFEVVFFYVIAKPQIVNSLDLLNKNIANLIKNNFNRINNHRCKMISDEEKELLKSNLLKLFYNYELSMKKNNKNIVINIVFIFTLIIFCILFVILVLVDKSYIKNIEVKTNIDWGFIPSTLLTVLFIILFQIHFYFNVSLNFEYVSSEEIMGLISDLIKNEMSQRNLDMDENNQNNNNIIDNTNNNSINNSINNIINNTNNNSINNIINNTNNNSNLNTLEEDLNVKNNNDYDNEVEIITENNIVEEEDIIDDNELNQTPTILDVDKEYSFKANKFDDEMNSLFSIRFNS